MTAESGDLDSRVDPVAREAAMRFARMRSGALSESEVEDLEAWLRDQGNADAFADVDRVWRGVEPLRTAPKLLALREHARRGWATRSFRSLGAIAAAVMAVFVSIGLTFVALRLEPEMPRQAQESARFVTSTGERKPIALADGSTIMLDAESSIHVEIDSSRRFVRLERGRAYFDVAHDTRRPFVVGLDGRSLTALGTAFSIDLASNRLDVVLVRGRVKVHGRPDDGNLSIQMDAGTRLLVAGGGRWISEKADNLAATSWMHGRLVFENAQLSDLCAEFNRYTAQKFVIENNDTAARRISAVINAGDVETLVSAIDAMGIAKVSRKSDGTIVLR
ncbi:FecR family protein [Rhizorhabdus argentea]|uniref:FecR family protein n=1 Tax=Rhizorhabdus argentea TaxID=1387174 RepID=UPI0030EE94CE